MSWTELQAQRFGLELALAALVVIATGVSSLSFSASAKAQTQTVEGEPIATVSNVSVAVVAGAIAGYGWVANKTYDLGKEVGKSLAGSKTTHAQQAIVDDGADYLLN